MALLAGDLTRNVLRLLSPMLLLTGSCPGQEETWQLPERSAAVYLAEISEPAKRAPWLAIPSWAPMILHGELAPERTHIAGTPVAFLGLPSHLAFDLRNLDGGRRNFEVRPDGSLPPLSVRARFLRPGPDGTQEIQVEIESLDEAKNTQGELRIERRFDTEQGRITWFRAELELGEWSRSEEWSFDRIEEYESARFRVEVANAILDGSEHLIGLLDVTPSELAETHDPGHLALILFTLFKAGRDLSNPVVARAWEDLKRREINETYHLACALLAMEALFAPPGERERLLTGEIDRPRTRELSADDRRLVQGWTDQLLENGDHTIRVERRRRWRYHRNDGYDNSNTQYALLGLYAAILCGAEVPDELWTAAIRHELADLQDTSRKRRRLVVTTHRDLEKLARTPQHTKARSRPLKPGAWGYHAGAEPTGSMTTAGVTALAICEAALSRGGRVPSELRSKIENARSRGLLWLSERLTVRANPGDSDTWRGRLHYYLYGLERTCEFLQIARLDNRDWYFEGAMQLLLTRDSRRDDVWRRTTDTCFAVLFLKKATYGPITGR